MGTGLARSHRTVVVGVVQCCSRAGVASSAAAFGASTAREERTKAQVDAVPKTKCQSD